MMQMKKNRYKYLCTCLFVVMIGLTYSLLCNARANSTSTTRVIILIDVSGSTSKEQPAIGQSLELLYKWLNKEQRQNSIEYWVFGEGVEKTTYEEYMDKKRALEQSTHIAQALEKVDEEVENAVNKEKIFVIVISDLVASEADPVEYTWDWANNEQEKIDIILKKWSKFRKEGQMDLLFVTWKRDECKNLADIKKNTKGADIPEKIKEQGGIQCDVESVLGYPSPIYDVLEKNDSVSGIEMAGCLIKRVAEMLKVTKMKEPRRKVGRENNMNLNLFYEAYVVTGRNNDLYVVRDDNKTFLSEYKIETEDLRLYCIPAEFNNVNIYETLGADSSQGCYLFYEEMPEIKITTDPQNLFANEEMSIICSGEGKNLTNLNMRLYVCIIHEDKNGEEEMKWPMPDGNGNLVVEKICLANGNYKVEAHIDEDRFLGIKNINVKERKKDASTDNVAVEETKDTVFMEEKTDLEKRTINLSIFFVIAAVLMAGGYIIHMRRG